MAVVVGDGAAGGAGVDGRGNRRRNRFLKKSHKNGCCLPRSVELKSTSTSSGVVMLVSMVVEMLNCSPLRSPDVAAVLRCPESWKGDGKMLHGHHRVQKRQFSDTGITNKHLGLCWKVMLLLINA